MAQYSALRCVSGIWQNSEKPLISNRLGFIFTCLLTAALWVLFHCARHTFAVHSLHKLVTSGEDIYSVMPVLSKFLGHKDLRGTERYVRLTHEIYPEINNIMSALTADIYPKPKDNNHENVF